MFRLCQDREGVWPLLFLGNLIHNFQTVRGNSQADFPFVAFIPLPRQQALGLQLGDQLAQAASLDPQALLHLFLGQLPLLGEDGQKTALAGMASIRVMDPMHTLMKKRYQ